METKRDSKNQIAQELVNDPKFLFRLGKTIGELGVVHERRNRLIVILACITMFLRDKVSILLSGPSSCGKSTIVETIIKLCPPELLIKRVSFSRKAFAYGKEPLDGRILYITEYRGGKEAQLLLRILLSEAELSHEFTTGRRTEVAQRLGSPVVLTTTTDETIFEDDSTRFLTIRVSETPSKILAVLKSAISRASAHEEPGAEVWQEAIRLIAKRAKKPFTFPDWLEFVAEQLPRNNVRVQRDWKRFLASLQAAALCRPQTGSSNEVTFADYCVVYRILNLAFTATAHAVNENEIAIQKAVKKLAREPGHAVTIRDIRDELSWTDGMVYKYVRLAAKHGLVKFEPGTRERNIKRLLPTDETVGDFLPNPKRVLEHIGRGKGKTEYVDPLTGETKRLMTGQ
jgi:energy-coupling factor transporter ATP-binding protein EcfA2